MKTSVIDVRDMLSVLSVEELEKRIGEVPGVASVTLNFAAGSATARYDETRLAIADIKSAVRQRGYGSAAQAAASAEPKPSPAAPAAASLPPASPAATPEATQPDATDMTSGLTAEEAGRRLADVGPNELEREKPTSPLRVFLGQFKGALVWLLIGACAISAIVGEVTDAIAIGTILLLITFIGFLQEYRAERAVLALRSMTAPRARVLRDGHATIVPAVEIVPGDVLLLEAGDVVAADAHLLEANALTTMEASLTGESAPIEKRTEPAANDAPLAER
ncbi:MAG: heavy metal translocating P-type ATPase, partial [Polyangiales bacterium]